MLLEPRRDLTISEPCQTKLTLSTLESGFKTGAMVSSLKNIWHVCALISFATASIAEIQPAEQTASLRVNRLQSIVTYLNGDIRLIGHPSGEERVLCSLGIPIFDIWPEDGLTKMEIFDDVKGRAIVIFELEGCRVSRED